MGPVAWGLSISRLPPGRRGLKHNLLAYRVCWLRRLPPGRRGLKRLRGRAGRSGVRRRLPPGRRGLKLRYFNANITADTSPSPRKAWIETKNIERVTGAQHRRLPPGRRGLKLTQPLCRFVQQRCLPPGRRGLKRANKCDLPHRRPVAFPPEGVD